MTDRSRRLALPAAALLALAVAACGSGAATTEPAPTLRVSVAPTVPASTLPIEMDVAKAAAMRDAGAFILDVRELDEWVTGHIPDATLIPLGSLASRAGEVPADRDIVVVCRSGNRSAQGRDILLNAGFKAVTSMAGGMNEWAAAGLPVATGE
ncbi:MAG: rhodanese-like domain-containing protein [Chloroflexota bacterium]